MSRWDELEGRAFIVPPVNLPAVALINVGAGDATLPLVDQTVWWLDAVDDGTVVGRVFTNFGGGWSETTLFGTISDDGDVVFSFTPVDDGASDDGTQAITIGRGTMTELDGEPAFLMQMSSGNGIGSVTHWAYMVEAEPSDAGYSALPGYPDSSVPYLVEDAPPAETPAGTTPQPDPSTIAAWERLEDTYWYVPPVNLPAQVLVSPGDDAGDLRVLPVADQTVWHFETVRDGYVVGRVWANVGGGWSEQILVGSVTPEGDVSFSFTPAEGASVNPVDGVEVAEIIVGLGEVVEVDGEDAFLMQMTAGGGPGTITHWAWMLEADPDDPAWAALPGYPDTGIPDLYPDAPPAEDVLDGFTPTPNLSSIAVLNALDGTLWHTPADATLSVLEEGSGTPALARRDVTVALAFETVRDGYIRGTLAVGLGEGWQTYGVIGSVVPGGALLLNFAGADGEPAEEISGEVRTTPDGTVVDLQFAFGDGVEAVAANLTLLPGTSDTPLADPSGATGATLGYVLEGASATIRLTAVGDTFLGLPADERVIGGEGDDTVRSGDGSDRLFGEAGDDVLGGGAGDDRVAGGEGRDRLAGASGNDSLRGDGGGDSLAGGAGDDGMAGNAGDDLLFGGRGDDSVHGADGDDTLRGAEGDDLLRGGDGDDLLEGASGSDHLRGGDGNDALRGWTGDDWLHAGAGDDTVWGGDGDDALLGGPGADRLFGGAGADTVTGGPGDDAIRLGTDDGDADVLVLRDGSGRDIVAAFEPGIDRLDVSGLGIDGIDDLTIVEAQNGARIALGGQDIVFLTGVAAAALAADDFIF